MRILALIPARSGSKRLPGKNKKILGGKPLISWSIEIAQSIPTILDVLISTDDPEIADVGLNAGVMVPWLRPAELATDHSSSADVAMHALNWYENHYGGVDGLLLLQPTSPFRSRAKLMEAIDLFARDKNQCVVGVSRSSKHPMWTLVGNSNSMSPFLNPHGFGKASQDLPVTFDVNGAVYIISPDNLRRTNSFVPESIKPIIFDSTYESLDIDTIDDFKFAEYVCEYLI